MNIAEKLSKIAENIQKVFDAGKKADKKEFWETYQGKGNRVYWQYAFAYSYWNDRIYDPIYPIKIGSANTNAFYNTPITNTKVTIDASGVALNYTFRESCIVTIPKLIVSETTEINNGFTSASSLKNLTIEGTLGRDCKVSWCPLSAESLKSIITALKDYSGGNEYTYTVTFKASSFSALEKEGSTAMYNGEPCTWSELIDNKKWNLTLL